MKPCSSSARGVAVIFSTHIMEHAERILLIDRGREVVSGALSEVKASHGRNAVQVEYDGDAAFVEALPFVERVRRFEVMAPSLHKIFTDLVGAAPPAPEDDEAQGGSR